MIQAELLQPLPWVGAVPWEWLGKEMKVLLTPLIKFRNLRKRNHLKQKDNSAPLTWDWDRPAEHGVHTWVLAYPDRTALAAKECGVENKGPFSSWPNTKWVLVCNLIASTCWVNRTSLVGCLAGILVVANQLIQLNNRRLLGFFLPGSLKMQDW